MLFSGKDFSCESGFSWEDHHAPAGQLEQEDRHARNTNAKKCHVVLRTDNNVQQEPCEQDLVMVIPDAMF